MIPHILKLDISGTPCAWISWQSAAALYSRGRVRWEAGNEIYEVLGGRSRDGSRSALLLNSIIATDERLNRLSGKRCPSSGRDIFLRDRWHCLYCATKLSARDATLDHVIPRSKGGLSTFANLATACRRCNAAKADRSPEEAGMPLLVLPYKPDPAAMLMLLASGRKITACQQEWLEASAKKAKGARH